jgi:DNA modification methylase
LKNDVFAAPLARSDEGHISAKPEEMLRYFLSMGVTKLTTFLDPTCGSGTAVRAATSLGAERALGLELNSNTAKRAQVGLQQALRTVSASSQAMRAGDDNEARSVT